MDHVSDTGGPAAPVLQAMPEKDRGALKAQLEAAFAPFRSDGGYQLPGVARAAVAS
jgi:hypothetical protein